ncbi:MAG: homogentisate 1,2-dioxygenase [Candidatus Obscuribacterales bacterium]|nr:homogentisate 1,2-dioxygenase [Candidatus Obscuribacterales bacterium]
MTTTLQYQSGFGNHFATEAEPAALPQGQNSPQAVAYGLYAEQLSGSSFLALRHENQRTWLYKIRPSVVHSKFSPLPKTLLCSRPFQEIEAPPDQMRWNPVPIPKAKTDFVEGLVTIAGNGDSASLRGSAVHIYAANRSMDDSFFYNADGDLLIVPEKGTLEIATEFGIMSVAPLEICVIPRGIKFQVKLIDDTARGYVCENYGPAFRLPHLGPIGSNGLANPRDFLAPMAAYKNERGSFRLIAKFHGKLWQAEINRNPLDVVAWHGNYYPYKYDLRLFNVINTVSFDHPDPSIFTVLSSPSEYAGLSNVDFVIFPPRWMVADKTFRPPYYHRNCMSEYMGLIEGVYDAKLEGFVPGGGSLHNCMSAHGPDAETFDRATSAELKPHKIDNTMAIMFESSLVYAPTKFAMESGLLQDNYLSCWQDLDSKFEATSTASKKR